MHDDGHGIGGAVAGAHGEHVTFRPGGYRPRTPHGRWVLAHELVHVAQQTTPGPGTANAETLERESHRGAWAAVRGGAGPAPSAAPERTMLLTEAQFRAQLGSTPEQVDAIDTLFAHPSFIAMWDWIRTCGATPQDLGPLALRVTPGLGASTGFVQFGGYDPTLRQLEVNPTKAEHVENPAELVDTIVHEVVHAIHDLRSACTAAGSPPPPIGAAATVPRQSRAAAVAAGTEAALNVTLGPGASNPCGEFIDINAAAQSLVTSIITDVIQTARVGRPTITFVNMIIRSDPAALASYETCRRAACALPTSPQQLAAVGRCSHQVIGEFMSPALLRALLPAFVYFAFNSSVIRPQDVETIDLVALFLRTHSATTVDLMGHADVRGAADYNLDLGLRRAEAVEAALLARGVSPSQITLVWSSGEAGPRGTTGSTLYRDRTVVISP